MNEITKEYTPTGGVKEHTFSFKDNPHRKVVESGLPLKKHQGRAYINVLLPINGSMVATYVRKDRLKLEK